MLEEFHILYILVGRRRNKFGMALEEIVSKGGGALSILLLTPSPPTKSWAMVLANHDSRSAEAHPMSSFFTSNLEKYTIVSILRKTFLIDSAITVFYCWLGFL